MYVRVYILHERGSIGIIKDFLMAMAWVSYLQINILAHVIIKLEKYWIAACSCNAKLHVKHLFSQNPATNTENSAQSRSEHIFMELTLFVYNINSP